LKPYPVGDTIIKPFKLTKTDALRSEHNCTEEQIVVSAIQRILLDDDNRLDG
jgi:hypothetical protein